MKIQLFQSFKLWKSFYYAEKTVNLGVFLAVFSPKMAVF